MVYFILNPNSGSKSTARKTQMVEFLKNIPNTMLLITEFPGHGHIIANQLKTSDATKIVAIGGDGTINEIASGLMGSGIPLGIIPLGSGNGLARHLGIPMDFMKAFQKALTGNIVKIDVLTWNKQPFFCTAGIGFDAKVAQDFAHIQGRGLKNYIKSTLANSISYKPIQITTTDGEESIFSMTFANANQFGNNAYISPNSNLQDALFEVVKIKPIHFFEKLELGIRLFSKGIPKHPKIYIQSTNSFICNAEIGIPYHIDGESKILEIPKIEIEIFPNFLKVIN
jgi:YegS/Rv2252/BmrU family lipid kinase